MALLTVTVMDVEGVLLPNVEVIAYLSNDQYEPIEGFDDEGFVIERVTAISNDSGVATFDLIPNADIHQPNTLYSIDIAGVIAPVLISKSAANQTLEQALVTLPPALGTPLGFDNLWDVDLTGLSPGQTVRWNGNFWIPNAWPSGGGGGGGVKPWVTLNTTQTLSVVDADNRHKVDASGGPVTITLPSAIGNNIEFTFKRVNSGVNVVTINAQVGQGIDGSVSYVLDVQWESVTLSSDNANWMVT